MQQPTRCVHRLQQAGWKRKHAAFAFHTDKCVFSTEGRSKYVKSEHASTVSRTTFPARVQSCLSSPQNTHISTAAYTQEHSSTSSLLKKKTEVTVRISYAKDAGITYAVTVRTLASLHAPKPMPD
jgi:hypothetical protein